MSISVLMQLLPPLLKGGADEHVGSHGPFCLLLHPHRVDVTGCKKPLQPGRLHIAVWIRMTVLCHVEKVKGQKLLPRVASSITYAGRWDIPLWAAHSRNNGTLHFCRTVYLRSWEWVRNIEEASILWGGYVFLLLFWKSGENSNHSPESRRRAMNRVQMQSRE